MEWFETSTVGEYYDHKYVSQVLKNINDTKKKKKKYVTKFYAQMWFYVNISVNMINRNMSPKLFSYSRESVEIAVWVISECLNLCNYGLKKL